jgi:hypothetical protein
MVSARAPEQALFGVSALLFAASAAVTIVWGASMSAMGEMPMLGGWLSWRRPSPSNVSHRPVSGSPEPSERSSPGREYI